MQTTQTRPHTNGHATADPATARAAEPPDPPRDATRSTLVAILADRCARDAQAFEFLVGAVCELLAERDALAIERRRHGAAGELAARVEELERAAELREGHIARVTRTRDEERQHLDSAIRQRDEQAREILDLKATLDRKERALTEAQTANNRLCLTLSKRQAECDSLAQELAACRAVPDCAGAVTIGPVS